MRDITRDGLPVEEGLFFEEVASPSVGDRLIAVAYYDGAPTTGELEVAAWAIDWDATRSVQGQTSLVIADPDGDLTPIGLDARLGVGGARLQLVYEFGATRTRVPLGMWRIRKVAPATRWQWRRRGNRHIWLPSGGTVTVACDEETSSVDLHRLDYTERWSTQGTALTEVTHLLADHMPIRVHEDVDDGVVLEPVEFDDNRLDAVERMLSRIHATHRIGADGVLEIVPQTGVETAWSIVTGDGGAYVTSAYTMSDERLANAVHSRNELTDTDPPTVLLGSAHILDGPLRYGGPFGRVPAFRSAIATTPEGVQADAETGLATLTERGDVEMTVECLTNPAVQPHDVVTLTPPSQYEAEPLTGRVTRVALRGLSSPAGAVPAKSMTITVAVPTAQLAPYRDYPRGD